MILNLKKKYSRNKSGSQASLVKKLNKKKRSLRGKERRRAEALMEFLPSLIIRNPTVSKEREIMGVGGPAEGNLSMIVAKEAQE